MKNIKILVFILVCLLIIGVKADMGGPVVVSHKVVVTNKNGAACYDGDKKNGKVIPYGTTLNVFSEINGSFIYVNNDDYSCDVKYTDVSAKDQSFKLENENVQKIESRKAIILAKGGLNMRKGPAVTYSKITTVPQYAVVSLTYRAGSYWYYTTYNGKSGWITGMKGYIGYEEKEVLINPTDIKIYSSSDSQAVLGKIPANTEINSYLKLEDGNYYIIYNNIKGYINDRMYYKTQDTGKIKLIEDYTIYDDNGKAIKKITAGQELEYNMVYDYGGFYIPAKSLAMNYLGEDAYEYIKEAKLITKTKGYLGEGLFGEEKTIKEEIKEEKEKEKETPEIPKEEEKTDIKSIIIIGLLAGIFAALTALVIIKLVNGKKKTVVEPVKKPQFEGANEQEIAKAREVIAREIEKERETTLNNEKENDNNKGV